MAGNLEASVRSRRTVETSDTERDLIEAGLNWPAWQWCYGRCTACAMAR